MAKQLNVNLAFTADSSQVKNELKSLQTQLTKLSNIPTITKNGLSQDIIKASNAAAELQVHLNKATNIKTGNLDFSKLNQSIKNSGSSLKQYGEQLQKLGPDGQQAFLSLANSIAKAEVPIRKTNALLDGMWTTLKNTARWQISSSILHEFMGAIQSAYGYAQDLNESLNNIRIVTGQNIDQMSRFAEQANKAAKALSTTTTEYTNASLIYYQQGLSDSEVAERTEVTIKMANAAGQSAEKVSDQLTAVWNNFAKGGENLEYYADVMTALGAATASSTDEISEGLNKFASVGETVGLSFEYAASALATVTATTRQSADVVGTAFKTLFARIQDLELGKTLDDGTTLGTYSKALKAVGVDIKDSNGEMKKMDTILNEMALKWSTLNKDQQVALAQSVAGVRQYTQLMALMENWDFMEQNVATSRASSGTLNEQAEIYAESWEAAEKRVQAATEAIYSDLLNDEFFIDVLNGFEKFLSLIDNLLDSMGGVKGALAGISALMFKMFSSQISQGIANMAYNMKMMTESGRASIRSEQTSFIEQATQSLLPHNPEQTNPIETEARQNSLQSQLQLQMDMMNNTEKMSAQEIEVNQMLLDRVRLMGEEVALKAQAVDLSREEVEKASLDARTEAIRAAQNEAGWENQAEVGKKAGEDYTQVAGQLKQELKYEDYINDQLDKIRQSGEVTSSSLDNVKTAIKQLNRLSEGSLDNFIDDLDKMQADLGESSIAAEDFEAQLRDISEAARLTVGMSGEQKMSNLGVSDEAISRVVDGYRKENKARQEKNEAVKKEGDLIEDLTVRISNAQGNQKRWTDDLVASAQNISSLAMGISSLGSVLDTISNPDLSGWEKFSSILMSLSMGIPMLITGVTGLNSVLGISSVIQAIAAARSEEYLNVKQRTIGALTAETMAEEVAALAKTAHISKKQAEIILTKAVVAEKLKEIAMSKEGIAAYTAEQLVEKTGMTMDQAKIVLSKLKAGATQEEAMKEAGLTGTKLTGVAASIASAAAKWAETSATWALVSGTWALLTALLPIPVVIAILAAALIGIIAVIAAVVNGIQALSDKYNEDAIAAENTAEAAKNLAAAYNEIKQEYEDMISTMENYQSAREGLDSLTKGTLEYKEALQKANEYALELIESGNLIKGQDYTVENGEIVINEGSMQKAKEEKFNEMQEAYASSTMANATAAQAKAKSNQTNLVRNNDDEAIGNLAAVGAGAGFLIPGIGPLVGALGGAVVGALGGAIYNGIDNAVENSRIDKLTALYDEIGEAAFDSATLQELGFDTANQNYINSIKEVVRETNSAADQMEAAAEIAASAILETNENYQNSEYKDQISSAAGKSYQSEYDKAYEEALKKTKNDNGIGDKDNKAAMQNYASQMGLDQLNGFKITNYKKGGNVEYEYIDENGDKQTKEVTQEQIAAQLASAEASEQLAASAETLIGTFERLNDDKKGGLADFASKDLSNSTKSEFDTMQSDLKDDVAVDKEGNKTLDEKAALDYINDNFSDEELQALGYDSAEQAAEEFKTSFETNLEAWDSIDLPDGLLNTDDMSLETAQNLENIVDEINLGPKGKKVGEDFVKGLNEMMEGVDPEDAQEALGELSNIDWSSSDALQQADDIMKQYGVDIDTSSESFKNLAQDMQNATGVMPDFSTMTEDLQSVSGILNDLEFGSVISDEDYNKLVDYNSEWEDFFVLQADGTRKFIGDAEEMAKATRDSVAEQRKDLQTKKELIDNLNNPKDGEKKADWSLDEIRVFDAGQSGSDDREQWLKEMGVSQEDERYEDYLNKGDKELVGNLQADKIQNLIDTNENFKKVLEDQNYDETAIAEIMAEARAGQTDRLEQMIANVDTYMGQDLKVAEEDLDQMMASTVTSVDELNSLLADGQISQDAYNRQLQYLTESGLAAATSLSELDQVVAQSIENGVNVSYDSYSEALIRLAGEYSNTSGELARYQEALETGDKETIQAAESSLKAAVSAGEMAEKYGLTAEHIERYADELKASGKYQKANKKSLTEMAKDQLRFDRAVNNAADNMKTWVKDLKVAEKTGHLVSETADQMAEAYGDLLDIDGSELSSDFLNNADNLDLMKKALEGDEEAYRKLQEAARQDIAARIGIDDAEFQTKFANLMTQCEMGSLEDIEVGASLNDENFLQGLTDMVNAAGMTAEEATDYLSSMGVDAEVITEPEEVEEVQGYDLVATPSTVPVNYTGAASDGTPQTLTASYPTVSYETKPVTTKKTVAGTSLKVTSASKSSGGNVKHSGSTTANGGSNRSGGGGGGGGSKPKPTSESRGKKTDIVDRYKEINDRLEETGRLMNKNSILAEGLWGPARFKKLKENIKLMEQENKQLKEKYELSKLYLKEDAGALLKAGQSAGVSFNIDAETGLIINYTNVMTKLYNEREALLNSFGDTMDEAEEERLAEFDKKIDAIKESYEQYETTLDEKKDAEEEHLQKILDIQTAYYDLLNEELEVNLSVNEKDLEILEYYLNKFSDDFYHMAEAATLMVGDFANGKMGGQIADYFSNIDMYRNNMDQMEKDHSTINPETGATYINDEQYVKALGDTMSNVLGELSNIINIDKQMLSYYADALAAAGEEVAKYTDRMEHLTGVLDHYRNIMSLMGKEKDYKKMGIIIAGQVKVAEDQMNAAKATYEMYVGQQKDIYDKWQAAIASGDTAAAELFEKEYYAITETVEEAQDNFLSSTEATLEAYKAELENNLAEIGEILENSLTGGKGFDWINSTMERMNSLHEEYLTTTNKIYETNKMMNQTQQEIDKTSNSVAKRKLKDFINQTKSLQEQTALSKFELDIQQAKYDLLLAEIALEEAQNAKSQVRLQRDSEGNFGYVYTADTSAIDDAQQKYEDAQNNLYNISLEGANKYAEQRNQLTQEFYDTMRELEQQWLDGSFASEEEYRAAQEEAQTYYYERLRQASELYNVAIGADASAAAEHILGQENLVYNESFTSFAGIAQEWERVNKEMMEDSSGWKKQVCEYVNGVIGSFNLWNQRCAEIEEKTHLDNLAKEVENITKKSEGLVDELTKEGGVIDSVEEQLNKVQKVTEAYALQRKEIQGLIKDLEKYIKTLQDKYKAETQPEEEPEEEKPEDTPTENNNSDTGAAAAALAQEARELVTAVHTGTIKNGVNGWIPSARSAGYSEEAISIALKAINESKTGAGYSYYYDKALALIDSYDTGGYTGEWNGSYGKLAMVHQKELILNENDTANFLAGMEIFRQIISTIDLQSANMAYLGNVNSPTLGTLQDGTLEQNVHIEASFPNVTDSNQIEEAFKDIVNLASQYANRK